MCSSLTPVFKNGEKGKIDYYGNYCVFVASDSKQLFGERMLLHFLIQEILDPRAMPCRVVVGGSHSYS